MKKTKIILAVILIISLSLSLFTACSKSVTITFDTDNGTAINAIKQDKDTTIDSEPVTTKAGYTFDGWYDGNTKIVFPYTLTEDKTLLAYWTATEYTATFVTNGGAALENVIFSADEPVIFPNYVSGGAPLGMKFAGWFENIEFKTKVISTSDNISRDLTLYAKWTPISYTITYNLDRGSGVENSEYNILSEDVSLADSAVKSGYTFGGWYDNEDFTGNAVTVIPKGSTGKKTFYAKWIATNYTITYIKNSGSGAENSTYTIESSDYVLAVPTRYGYTFEGWFNNDAYEGDAATTIAKGSTGNKIYFAKWTATNYQINYILNGGAFVGEYPLTYTVEKEVMLVSPELSEKAFGGWFGNAELAGNPVDKIEEGQTGAKTFYAKWTVASLSITYNLDGGQNSSNNPSGFNSGSEISLSNPSKTGYSFLGWFDNAQLSGTVVSVIAAGTNENVELWASWEIISYTITYTQNGGTGAVDTTYTVNSPSITLTIPEREGFTFVGWYTVSDFNSTPVTTIPERSTGNKNFFAKWERNNYEIIFISNGGTSVTTINYNVEYDSISLPSITKLGYTFNGWFDNVNLTGTAVTEVPSGSFGTKTFYAKWTIIDYTITYNLSGGTGATNTTYNVESQTITLPVLTKTGFDFGGWFLNSEFTGSQVLSIAAGSTGNKAFYAKFSASVPTETYTLEAEETYLDDLQGAGYSGSAQGSSMIVNNDNASGGKYIGWMNVDGIHLDYVFNSDRAVSNAKLTVIVGFEQIQGIYSLVDVTLTQKEFSIIVNGVSYQYSKLIKAGDDASTLPFTAIVIENVQLNLGANTISLQVNDNKLWGGERVAGPGIDCIKIDAAAILTWTKYNY